MCFLLPSLSYCFLTQLHQHCLLLPSITLFLPRTITSGLYGEQVILLQYLCHICELVASCRRKLSTTMEGGLLGAMALLQHLLPYLSDHTFMEYLQVSSYVTSRLLGNIFHFDDCSVYLRKTVDILLCE